MTNYNTYTKRQIKIDIHKYFFLLLTDFKFLRWNINLNKMKKKH